MIIKKSTVLLSSPCLSVRSFASISNTSLPSYQRTRSPQTHTPACCCSVKIEIQGERRQKRSYASVASNEPSDDYAHLRWPSPPTGHMNPTPYQIFSLKESQPYSKQRFYELVKLYHPDRSSSADIDSAQAPVLPSTHPCHNLAPAQKLERYRLIVAANGILSDPVKRSAYDRFGAGWTGMIEPGIPRNSYGTNGWRDSYKSGEPNIWNNATWEDWERFYAARDPSHPMHQSPMYLRNSYFVTVVLMLTLVGSVANYGRADSAGEKFLEARDAVHDRASKELRRVRQQSESRPKEERIQFFVKQREASMMGLGVDEVRAEKLKRLLPEQESCMSGDLKDKEWDDEQLRHRHHRKSAEE